MQAFLKGFLSAYDLSGRTIFDLSSFSNAFERDKIMLQGDWIKVGNDMKNAINQVVYEK